MMTACCSTFCLSSVNKLATSVEKVVEVVDNVVVVDSGDDGDDDGEGESRSMNKVMA